MDSRFRGNDNMAKTILIVDDEPEFLNMVKLRLEANGYITVTASDGQEGVRQAKQVVPDLILIDVMMPKMDGGDTVRLLKADPKTSGIPIIFITAILDNLDGEQQQKIIIGNNYFPALPKPFTPEKLLRKIRECLMQ